MNKIFFETRNFLKENLPIPSGSHLPATIAPQDFFAKYGRKLKYGAYAAAVLTISKFWYNWATKEYLQVCSGLDKIDRRRCIINQNIKAHLFVISQIQKNISQCQQTSNPKNCVAISNVEIKKWQMKIQKLQQELAQIQ